jgi:hypothetical protein
MGELIGLAEFAQTKRRRLDAQAQAESACELRAEALLDEAHRYRMSTQRRERRRLAASRRIAALVTSDQPRA